MIIKIAREDDEAARSLLTGNQIDFGCLFDLMREHRITGIFCRRLVDNFSGELPTSFLLLCKMTVLKGLEQNRVRWNELKSFCLLFEEREIPLTLLKGFAFDPVPDSLRQFNDVDVLIPEAYIKKALSVLEEADYTYMGSEVLSEKEKKNILSQLKWNNQYQFRCPRSELEIEVHINLFERDRIRLENLRTLLDQLELFTARQTYHDELHCHIPCAEASFVLLCLHTALKRSPAHNTYILRQACDMKKILKGTIDREYILFLCRSWHVAYYVYFALRLQELIMDEKEELLLESLEKELTTREKKLVRIHLACFIDLSRNSLWHMLRYRLLMPVVIGGGLKKSLSWYFQSLFPPRRVQEKKYGISQRSPLIFLTYLINPFRAGLLFIRQSRRHLE